MVYTLETVDRTDKHAKVAGMARKASGEATLGNCWSSLQVNQNTVWEPKYRTNSSNPGGSHLLHAERNVILRYIEKKVGGLSNSQSNGFTAGQRLQAAGVSSIIVFTELPPCPGCRAWYNQIVASGVQVHVKIINDLEDYWDKNDYQRNKAFREWIDANFS